LFTGRLLKIKEKHNLSIYVRLHIFRPGLTGGYTGKAKSCIGAWVPTVSIHRPLCFKKFILKGVQKSECFLRGSRGKTVRERAVRQREGKGNPRDEGNRWGGAGSSETPICSMIKGKRKRTTTGYKEAKIPRTAS
jgi:hypothetical protein